MNSFLRNAQQESVGSISERTTLDVYLMNGYQLQIDLMTTDQTNDVLHKVCQQMNLPHQYIDYFALFVIRRDDDNDMVILRKLQPFESPCISQKLYNKIYNKTLTTSTRIYLRKM